MSSSHDINTIDKETEEKWKKIIGQKLIDIHDDSGDLKLIFEKVEVIISCQESDAYGIGVFHEFRAVLHKKPHILHGREYVT